jgi:hypothetical protein
MYQNTSTPKRWNNFLIGRFRSELMGPSLVVKEESF